MTPGLIRIRAKQAAYFALSIRFGFDRWHYRVVRENSGYFARVQDIHHALQVSNTVEIGCGLGEVLGGLDSRVRIGIDRDLAVIRAARFLRGRHIRFSTGEEAQDATLFGALRGPTCLVMLNWLHSVDADTAVSLMAEYRRRTRADFVMFDVIHPGSTTYRYHHLPETFASVGKVEAVDDALDSIRRIVTLRVSGTPGAA
jgi:hypothetical protein